MNILFLSRWFPWPPNNGAKLRIYHLLRMLSKSHSITLLAFADQGDETARAQPTPLTAMCSSVEVVAHKPFEPTSRRALGGLFSATPRSAVDMFSPEMAAKTTDHLANNSCDLIIASEWDMAAYSDLFGDTPALFEELEVGLLYQKYAAAESTLAKVRHGLSWLKHRRYLIRLLNRFDACTVVSEGELELVRQIAPHFNDVTVIPNGIEVDPDFAPPTKRPDTLIFTGSFRYQPNYDAMLWFLDRVFPLILQDRPQVELFITGDHAGLPLPEVPNVHLTGFVDDIRTEVASAAISIAPLLSGGGTRLKILEAMALQTPVVATTKGAEGIAAEHGRDLMIADEPGDFAGAVLRLFDDPARRRELAQNGRRLVAQRYDWAVVEPPFLALINRLGRHTQTRPPTADPAWVNA